MASPSRIELGCGSHKREGFFGIDIAPSPVTDLVMDVETQPLPFPDNSVDHIYTSHAFEHLEKPGSPIPTLKEIVRVARHGALVEVWTPYGKSNDALLLGHRNFYTESHWHHICWMYDDFYLGGVKGRFKWEKTQYVLWPGILEKLERVNVPLSFAIDHMYNVALEFGVFLRVDKSRESAEKPQYPVQEFCYRRGELLHNEQLSQKANGAPAHAHADPFRRSERQESLADLKALGSQALFAVAPGVHALLKRTLGKARRNSR